MADQAARKGGHRLQLVLLSLVAVASWGFAVYFRVAPPRARAEGVGSAAGPGFTAPSSTEPGAPGSAASSSASSASRSTSAAEASGEPSTASTTAASTATASASTAAAAAPGDSQQLTACVSAMFPPASFERGRPDFAFVCDERYPRKAVTQIQAQLSLDQWGTGEATVGMREWAVLGWYELAALAVFRGHCCAAARPLEWTFKLACPIDKAMGQVETAVRRQEQAAVEAAVSEYTRVATCLTRQGQAPNFGQRTLPGPGVGTFRKMLARMRAAERR
jgi:hypothetical protein